MAPTDVGALLPLFIAVPLIAAGLAAVAPWAVVRRTLGIVVPAAGVLGGAWLVAAVSGDTSTVAHAVGGYPGGVSIPLAADTFTGLMIVTTGLIALTANWFADAVGETAARFYPALTLMLIGGVWGAVLTADLFNLFVFVEVMLMPSYGLLAMTGTWARLASARMFVIVNLVTSAVLVIGVGFTYAVVGTTNLAALAGAAGPRGVSFADGVHGTQWQLVVALGLVLLALGVKAGMAPVHTWLPRAYPSTSPAVMSLFSGLHTKVGVYAIIRVFMVVFEGDPAWSWAIIVITVAGMLIGAFAGMAEASMRGVLAYQMVNGIPFILVALAFVAENPRLLLSAALFYMLHHMVTAGSLIMTAGAVEETYGTGRIRTLSGLLRRDPFPAAVFAAGALSIIGFPPFSGVWGKLALVLGVAGDGTWKAWLVVGAILVAGLGSLFSMLYVWREVFWGKPMSPKQMDPSLAVSPRFVLPGATLLAVSVAMFVGAGGVFALTNRAADDLTDTAPYVHAVLGGERGVGSVLDTDSFGVGAARPTDPSPDTPGTPVAPAPRGTADAPATSGAPAASHAPAAPAAPDTEAGDHR
ncbi:monovalent cation/H+ antiporter subunit D family protein [Corynebacterium bovis]|uniref:monovalent cation/H+ antiporter subunit D family protein n=1 Tax=Corynebacterium bovis TaxID=36808 RepID=UPI000F64C1D0|nr:monovalent cation/H+ antiporter subunit D family protein [Corynebacterium bovis]RRO86962.1 cation:proton antiporter [Corynebacterium bovis]RRQ17163.1 cation:proton antiporter [Corynebacterium bovis]